MDDLRGAVLAVSPDTRAGRIGFKARPDPRHPVHALRLHLPLHLHPRPIARLEQLGRRREGQAHIHFQTGCGCHRAHPPAPLQVAYGLNEEQMRRWGLYVSRPLGPEESITLFSGMC